MYLINNFDYKILFMFIWFVWLKYYKIDCNLYIEVKMF